MALFLAGMPLVATFLGGLFGGLVSFFLKFVGKKLAIFSAVLIAIATLTGVFIVAVQTALSTIAISFPPEFANIGLFIPTNLQSCIAASLTISLLRWVYDWNIKVWQFKLNF